MKIKEFNRRNKVSRRWKKLIYEKTETRISAFKASIWLAVLVLSISVGYSALGTTLNISGLLTKVRLKQDIRITDFGVAAVNLNDGSSYAVGDMVSIGDENFYVINSDDENIELLAEYNITIDLNNPRQDEQAADIHHEDIYWYDEENDYYYPKYSSGFIYDSNSTLYPYVEAYESYLKSLGLTNASATLMNLEQAEFINNSAYTYTGDFWIGYAYPDGTSQNYVAGNLVRLEDNPSLAGSYGIRPVIVISKEALSSYFNKSTSNYTEFNKTKLISGVTLPYEDSKITYEVEVTNIGNVEMGILSIDNLPSDLEATISGYKLKEKICDDSDCSSGIVKTFYLTIGYADGFYGSSTTTFDLNLDVNFQPFYSVTYNNIEQDIGEYPTEVIGNDTLKVDFAYSYKVPSNLIITVGGTRVYDYELIDTVLYIPNITGNVEISAYEEVETGSGSSGSVDYNWYFAIHDFVYVDEYEPSLYPNILDNEGEAATLTMFWNGTSEVEVEVINADAPGVGSVWIEVDTCQSVGVEVTQPYNDSYIYAIKDTRTYEAVDVECMLTFFAEQGGATNIKYLNVVVTSKY